MHAPLIGFSYTTYDPQQVLKSLSKEKALDLYRQMVTIRHFEIFAENCYLEGLVAGFFHSYIGQEAIQVGAVGAIGKDSGYWVTTYRCHALALLTGCEPLAGFAELFGNQLGCAKGRGGSMHFVTDRMPLGEGIVGGHTALSAGFAFKSVYQGDDLVTYCFLGDGASVQGTFYESLNLASLWSLPVVYVIENNVWGMGTHYNRAVAMDPIGPSLAKAFNLESYLVDGMNVLDCYQLFKDVHEKVKKTKRPIIIEAKTQRFKGHSRSDTEYYRSKEEMETIRSQCPIERFKAELEKNNYATLEELKKIETSIKEDLYQIMEEAKKGPPCDPSDIESGVEGD
ncbi:MAG: thiamine pyrophosphate-dependent enzyme [Chlamydiia bacterium]